MEKNNSSAMDYSKIQEQEEMIKYISEFLGTSPTLNSIDNLDALTGPN